MPSRHFFLKFLDLGIFKLHDGSAAGANEVVVVTGLPDGLIAGDAISKVVRLGEPTLREEPQRSVNGRVADALVSRPDPSRKLID